MSNKDACALALAFALKRDGWTVTDYNIGVCDGMTDYFQRGYWNGRATHPEYPGCDVHATTCREERPDAFATIARPRSSAPGPDDRPVFLRSSSKIERSCRTYGDGSIYEPSHYREPAGNDANVEARAIVAGWLDKVRATLAPFRKLPPALATVDPAEAGAS